MLNKVTLLGHAGLTPETRALDNGTKVARISLATSKSVKQADGSFKEFTTWHNVVGFGYSAEKLSKVQKGDKVLIEGEISSRQYDKDGAKHYITDINANNVINLTPRAAAPLLPIADRYDGAIATQEEFEQHLQEISPVNGEDLPF